MNTNNKHTPGPWTKDELGDAKGNYTIRPADGSTNGDIHAEVIATVYTEEDAELIRKAPEMAAEIERLTKERDELKRALIETDERVNRHYAKQREAESLNAELLEALKDAAKILRPIVRKMKVRDHFTEINILENSVEKAIRKAEGKEVSQ